MNIGWRYSTHRLDGLCAQNNMGECGDLKPRSLSHVHGPCHFPLAFSCPRIFNIFGTESVESEADLSVKTDIPFLLTSPLKWPMT